VNYMITIGTAPDLDPETSTTYTAGFDYELMRGRQSLTLSGSYYDIRFEDRLGVTPVPGNLNANYAPGFAFADPGLFPEGTVIFFPSE
ncbi:TonB-dependent receptor domain-containing protein, partial [Hyphomonas oceanitis]